MKYKITIDKKTIKKCLNEGKDVLITYKHWGHYKWPGYEEPSEPYFYLFKNFKRKYTSSHSFYIDDYGNKIIYELLLLKEYMIEIYDYNNDESFYVKKDFAIYYNPIINPKDLDVIILDEDIV